MKLYVVVVVLMCASAAFEEPFRECPAKTNNKFCFCIQDTRGYTPPKLVCDGITESSQIIQALNSTWENNNEVEHFLLRNSNVQNISAGIFNNIAFRNIEFIGNNNLTLIDRYVFVESENHTLDVNFLLNDFGNEFNLGFLQTLRSLRTVSFRFNKILSISDNAFGNLPNLEKIEFFRNKFLSFGKLAFASLPKLKSITMTQCGIEKLGANMFNTSQSEKDIQLDLSDNLIQEIDPGAFADLKVHNINLQFNKLTTLNQTIFEPLLDSMLRYENSVLFLDGNPFYCDSSIEWLLKKPVKYLEQVRDCPCTGTLDCGRPKVPSFGGIIFMSGIKWKSRVTYACDDDYTAIGSDEIECMGDGKWSGSPLECIEPCRVNHVNHGFFLGNDATDNARHNMIRNGKLLSYGSTLKIGCGEGYILMNENFVTNVTCDRFGQWKPSVFCEPVGCNCDTVNFEKLFERNLTMDRECGHPVRHNSRITLKCNSDALQPITNNEMFLSCDGGKWIYPQELDDRCLLEVSCHIKELIFHKGKILRDGHEWQAVEGKEALMHGTELRFECTEKGHELYHSYSPVSNQLHAKNFTVMTCKNGHWLGRVPVCRPARCSCSILSLKLAGSGLKAQSCEDAVSSGDFVQLLCISNLFTPNGTLIAECEVGDWYPINASCIG